MRPFEYSVRDKDRVSRGLVKKPGFRTLPLPTAVPTLAEGPGHNPDRIRCFNSATKI